MYPLYELWWPALLTPAKCKSSVCTFVQIWVLKNQDLRLLATKFNYFETLIYDVNPFEPSLSTCMGWQWSPIIALSRTKEP
jgi:hypothetical protein